MSAHKTKASGLVNGRRMRATRLDGCGRPIYGDDSTAVSKGFVSVAYSANTNDTDAVSVANANNETCIFQPGKTILNGYGIEIDFCGIDPALLSMMTGQTVRLSADGSTIVGFNVDTKVDLTDSGVALEVWAGSSSTDACSAGASGSYGYLLIPFLQGGILGDFTVQAGAIDFTLTGANSTDGNSWGVGPYNVTLDASDDPGPLNEALSTTDALILEFVGVAPPAAYDGLKPLMDPSADAITAITGSPTGLSVAFATTPADITTPVYYDFGDGTWDYIPASGTGDATHVYAAAGTYTVTATTNGTEVTTSVTVTA